MHKRTSFTFPCTCGWINAFCASFWKHSYNAVYNKEWEDQNTIEVLLLLPRDLWKVFRHPQESTGHFHKHHQQFWRKKGNHFRWHWWGSSLLGLRTLDPSLGPERHQWKFLSGVEVLTRPECEHALRGSTSSSSTSTSTLRGASPPPPPPVPTFI